MGSTHHNVVALNRSVLRALRADAASNFENSAFLLGINPQFCKNIGNMTEERFEALVRTVNTPLLTGASINASIWELFVRELESEGDMKHACTRINTVLRMQRDD